MKYKIYKFEFAGGVHFGKSSLEDSEYTFYADTLFSALCKEAVKEGEDFLKNFVACAKQRKFVMSDAFPYIGDKYFLPKPMLKIESDNNGDSKIKKAYKKLKYIDAEKIESYLSGEYDVISEEQELSKLGVAQLRTMASVRGLEETMPFRTGVYYFNEENGLYIIVGFEDEVTEAQFEDLLSRVSFEGIGGKRSSGLGRFEINFGKIPETIKNRLLENDNSNTLVTLSVSLPTDGEIKAIMEEAQYTLIKRSGFVSSETFSDRCLRKRDLYVFKSGACFKERFKGDIYDVSDGQGKHPVYRYAIPMFLEV